MSTLYILHYIKTIKTSQTKKENCIICDQKSMFIYASHLTTVNLKEQILNKPYSIVYKIFSLINNYRITF